jgi:transposase-like protein
MSEALPGNVGTVTRKYVSQERSNPMKSISGDRVADLGKELDAISSNNVLFWKRAAKNSRGARVRHQLKLKRLDEIMKELISVAEARRKEQALAQNKSDKARRQKQILFHATNFPENSALANERGLNPAFVIVQHKISGKEQSGENQDEPKSGRKAHRDLTVQSFAKIALTACARRLPRRS